jgi:hypothetical protein
MKIIKKKENEDKIQTGKKYEICITLPAKISSLKLITLEALLTPPLVR